MDASAYRRFSIAQNRGEMALFERLGCTGTGALLDIGCGDGRLTAQMAEALPQWAITGLDPNNEMLDLADISFAQPNLRFVRGTLDHLPTDNTFDAITLFNTLKFIPHAEAFLADMHRRLNPGGQLLIFAHPLDSLPAQIFREVLLEPEWKDNIDHAVVNARRYLSDYQQILDQLGFDITYCDVYESPRYTETREELVETMSMVLPLYGKFNPDEQRRCAEAITDRMGTTDFKLLRLAYIGRV